eukprot:TRINITY_DN22585_c0_g1_i1.p1 TRINITY_DN22585_c0_g1~~TRINITY_DN22585_c0_g1_i1.p1  ORF type:complete len:394 (+),score=75.23 TRINITY_DN22585_c0_g1_i1:81-1184(+)
MRRAAAAARRAGKVCTACRHVIIGADFADDPTNVSGLPRYAEKYEQKLARNRGRRVDKQAGGRRQGAMDPSGALGDETPAMFATAEGANASSGHREAVRRMATPAADMPSYRVSVGPVHGEGNAAAPAGSRTQIILDRYERSLVLGTNDDDTVLPFKSAGRLHVAQQTLMLYRAFWRVLRRYPAEVRPRLARVLRRAFKRNKAVIRRTRVNSELKLGKHMLLRHIDFLARRERLRTSHDPVERFLVLHAEEEERWIDSLDFYPWTHRSNELKPIHDIGFHMVMRKEVQHGAPSGWTMYAGCKGVRTFYKRPPKKSWQGFGPAMRSQGSLTKIREVLKQHKRNNMYKKNRDMKYRTRPWNPLHLEAQR